VIGQALLYGSPVIYPITLPALPETLKQILLINPLTPIFEQARAWVIDPTAPSAVAAAGGFVHLIPAIAVFLATCAGGVWVFRREAPRIAELL
jgi:ABC-2 type transport system permease protein